MKYPHTLPVFVRAAMAFSIIAACLLSSCKKSDSTTDSDSQSQLLTSSNWNLQGYQVEESGGTWIADPNPPASYMIQFSTNSKFSIYQGTSFYEGYTWYIGNGLVLTGSFLEGTWTINQLTTSTLEITEQNYPSGGTYIGERITFTH